MNDTVKNVANPEEALKDPLTELLRNGSRELLRQVVDSELMSLFYEHKNLKMHDGQLELI